MNSIINYIHFDDDMIYNFKRIYDLKIYNDYDNLDRVLGSYLIAIENISFLRKKRIFKQWLKLSI